MSKILKTKNEMLNGMMIWLQNAHEFTDLTSETLEMNKELYSGTTGEESQECIQVQQQVLEMYFTTMNGKIHDILQKMMEVIESNGTTAQEVEDSCNPGRSNPIRTPTGEYLN